MSIKQIRELVARVTVDQIKIMEALDHINALCEHCESNDQAYIPPGPSFLSCTYPWWGENTTRRTAPFVQIRVISKDHDQRTVSNLYDVTKWEVDQSTVTFVTLRGTRTAICNVFKVVESRGGGVFDKETFEIIRRYTLPNPDMLKPGR